MTIQYIPLSDSDYSGRRFDVILLVEGNIRYPYRDSLGYPTIGIGFKIQDNWKAILEGMKFDMTPQAPAAEKGYIARIKAVVDKYGATVTDEQMTQYKNELDAIMAERAAAYKIIRKQFIYLTKDEVRTTYDSIVPNYEDRLSKWLGETTGQTMYTIVPKGFERIALLSLTYNGYIGYNYQKNKPIGSPSLRKALLVDGNRAEAWYEIRYNTPGSAQRLDVTQTGYSADMFNKIKRNFFEAELFGLYDNPASVGADEAKQVYRMFQNHRSDIAKQEERFGVAFDGTIGTYRDPKYNRTPLQAANGDYNAATIFNDQAIDGIITSLNPAKAALFTYLQGRRDLPDISNKLAQNNISSTNIYLNPHKPTDPNRTSVLDSLLYQTGQYANGANDLMIGMDQTDYMDGNKGDDVLIGEDGNDWLWGGDGNDVLYGGGGNDVLIGGEGNDTMYGGADNDVYFIKPGDGNDTIEDKQGNNKIYLCGKQINFFYDTGTGEYKSPDGSLTGVKNAANELVVTDVASNTKVILNENFQWGDFGTTLIDLPDGNVLCYTSPIRLCEGKQSHEIAASSRQYGTPRNDCFDNIV